MRELWQYFWIQPTKESALTKLHVSIGEEVICTQLHSYSFQCILFFLFLNFFSSNNGISCITTMYNVNVNLTMLFDTLNTKLICSVFDEFLKRKLQITNFDIWPVTRPKTYFSISWRLSLVGPAPKPRPNSPIFQPCSPSRQRHIKNQLPTSAVVGTVLYFISISDGATSMVVFV